VSILALGDFISHEVANLTLNKQQAMIQMSGAKTLSYRLAVRTSLSN
jgi:hypothetical protein